MSRPIRKFVVGFQYGTPGTATVNVTLHTFIKPATIVGVLWKLHANNAATQDGTVSSLWTIHVQHQNTDPVKLQMANDVTGPLPLYQVGQVSDSFCTGVMNSTKDAQGSDYEWWGKDEGKTTSSRKVKKGDKIAIAIASNTAGDGSLVTGQITFWAKY